MAPKSSRARTNARYSRTPEIIQLTSIYEAVTLYGDPFQGTSTWSFGCNRANTTSPACYHAGFSLPYTAFARCYSQHPNWFLFLPVLRCFNSQGIQSFRINSGILGSKTACVSPRLIAACHALHRLLSLVIH